MAVYRNIHLSFWTDNKVDDDFTPEDKYFYLYLLTNPQTNICGCYEISYGQARRYTGYSRETIERLLERFETVHNVIRFNPKTKEVLLLNWHKYNWSRSERTLVGIENVAHHIKTLEFKNYVLRRVYFIRNNKSSTPEERKEMYERIVKCLNEKCGTNYKADSTETRSYINQRLNEGYTEEDIITVIIKKSKEWKGTKYERFLTPYILFGLKFESYLNQNIIKGDSGTGFSNFKQRDYDFEELEKQLLESQKLKESV